jgi:hypothetical protein
MKAEHRHELKTNELVDWLQHLPQWFSENRTTIIGAVVVVAVTAGLYIWKVYTKDVVAVKKQLQFTNLVGRVSVGKMQVASAQTEERDLSFILLQPAEGLKNLAQNPYTDQMAALALIKIAEAMRSELHYRISSINPAELATRIEQAKTSYNQAIEKAASGPSLLATAKFGLGLCEEELGNFDKAAQMYREVVEDPNFQATVACAAAKFRLDTMGEYKQKLAFRPAPKPIPTPVPRPVIERLPIDTNLPADVNQKTQLPSVSAVPDANPGPQSPNNPPAVTDSNSPGK